MSNEPNTDKVSTQPEILKQKLQESKELFWQPNREFVKSKITPTWLSSASNRGTKYTVDQVKTLLGDPVKNYRKLQKISLHLWHTSPVYQNFIMYLATIMTFDYVLYPDDDKNATTLQKRLMQSAKIVKQAQVKTNFPNIMARTLLLGETFLYELIDKGNTIFKEIPNNICELAMVDDNNLWRYFVNLAFITPQSAYELPEEIQDEYYRWIEGGKNKKNVEKLIEGHLITIPAHYYLVSNKGYSVFAHMQKNSHDYPYLASMFPDLIRLEDDKEYFDEFIKEANLKIIHMKIPIDDDGYPLLDKDTIDVYHETTKDHVPSTVKVATNPFEMVGINMDKGQSSFTNIVEHSDKVVKSDSGISSTIFEANTTNGLGYSTEADAAKMYPLLQYFTNIVNNMIKDTKWKSTFLPINIFNRKEWHERFTSDLANGGIRMKWISTGGLEIYDELMLAKAEQDMDLESLFPPKMSANQMSGNDEGGREELPEEKKSDSTVKVQGTQ